MSDKPILKEISDTIDEFRNNRSVKITHFTNEERQSTLWELYDGALIWLFDCVNERSSRGTGAATLVMEKARMEILALSNTSADATSGYEITFDALAKIVGDDVTKEA